MQAVVRSPLGSGENIESIFKTDFTGLSLQEIVDTSKYRELLAELKKTLKTDLHTPLGGAISVEFIAKYSTGQEYAELIRFIDKLRSGMDYSEGFKVFSMIGKVLKF